MILKTILAAIGFGAIPALRNEIVHEARNKRAAALAAHQGTVRSTAAADRAHSRGDIEGERLARDKTAKLISDLDTLAKGLD